MAKRHTGRERQKQIEKEAVAFLGQCLLSTLKGLNILGVKTARLKQYGGCNIAGEYGRGKQLQDFKSQEVEHTAVILPFPPSPSMALFIFFLSLPSQELTLSLLLLNFRLTTAPTTLSCFPSIDHKVPVAEVTSHLVLSVPGPVYCMQ